MAKTKKADAAAAPTAEGDAAPAKAESPKKETAAKAGKVAKRGRKKKASPKKAKGKKAAAKKWASSGGGGERHPRQRVISTAALCEGGRGSRVLVVVVVGRCVL